MTSLQSSLGTRQGFGAHHLRRTSTSLTTKFIHPDLLHPCNRNNLVMKRVKKAPFPIPTRSSSLCKKSLLITCQSTISDETAQAESMVATIDSTTTLPPIINDFNGVNGHSKLDLISFNNEQSDNNQQNQKLLLLDDETIPSPDIPTLTANGGYTHTSSSKAKISAANKGKVPWNKGQSRSDEVKARISEGVLRRNREKFLAQLAQEGITEEQYNEQKKAERRKKDAERRARRTAKGGYKPTEETKQKISSVLKERYSSGEMKRAPRDPSTIRRGFQHTEETKAKIRESLKRKWAEDTEYRALMTNKTIASGNVGSSVRKRIAETLKKRWEDPEFRNKMMESFANRKSDSSRSKQISHRQRISAAMKKKWMDEEYRQRATEGMAKVRGSTANNNVVKAVMPIQPKIPRERRTMDTSDTDGLGGGVFVQPLEPLLPIEKQTPIIDRSLPPMKGNVVAKRPSNPTTKKVGSTKRKFKSSVNISGSSSRIEAVKPITISTTTSSTEKSSMKTEPDLQQPKRRVEENDHEQHADGCISRMREERRDLYDLLYGDEDEDENEDHRHHSIKMGKGGSSRTNTNGESTQFSSGMIAGVSSNTVAALFGDDDDLDDFDPYGLHDTSPSPL
jgi:hypothetical protein